MSHLTPDQKRQQEQELVTEMIALYCRKRHHDPSGLCPDCRALAAYARDRSLHCPRMEEKSFCSTCPSPCYRPDMRDRIRTVMRFSGPRMLFHHPSVAIRHLFITLQAKCR